MRITVSFVDLLVQAWRTGTSSRSLLVFIVPFGLLAFGSTLIGDRIIELFPETTVTMDHVTDLWDDPKTLLLLFLPLLGIAGVQALLRGPFFLLAETRLLRHTEDLREAASPNRHTLFMGALWSLLLEGLYFGGMVILAFCLSLPLFFAFRFNPSTLPSLMPISLILFCIIALTCFYIKEFALLYRLLARTRVPIALELSLRLFRKHLFQSLLFGLFLMAIASLFTFLANLVIIASDSIGLGVWHAPIKFVSILVIFGFASIFQELLRLLFFHALAATPKQPLPKLEKLLEEKTPDSAPSV